MKTIKRFHPTERAALKYIESLGSRGEDLRAYKCNGGRYWVGSYIEWLNR